MSEVEDVIDAIDSGDLEKLSELLDDKNVNITKLYHWAEQYFDISIFEYAMFHLSVEITERRQAEVVALLIEKTGSRVLTTEDAAGFTLLQKISRTQSETTESMRRIIFIAHIVSDMPLRTLWTDHPRDWIIGGLDWQSVQYYYNILPAARVMDPDWYIRQTFKRPDEKDNGKLKYSKEVHLAWAIAYLLRHYGGMKNLTKWGIAHAVALMDESHEMGIKRAQGRTPPPRFALKY